MSKIREWYGKFLGWMPDEIRAGWNTAMFAFIGTFGLTASAWLMDFQDALNNGGEYPSLPVLGSAAVAALVAAGTGLVNVIIRWIQSRMGWGSPPSYTTPGNVVTAEIIAPDGETVLRHEQVDTRDMGVDNVE